MSRKKVLILLLLDIMQPD